MHSPATSSRYYRTGDEDGISRTDTASAPTPLLCPDPAYWWREARLTRGDSLLSWRWKPDMIICLRARCHDGRRAAPKVPVSGKPDIGMLRLRSR